MTASRSDALVLFGVTGDLAHKMIFPALYAMAKRGALNIPVIGVAFPKWSLERLHQRVTDSIKRAGGIDNKRALHHLLSLLKYVGGDYEDPDTFTAIRTALGSARRPAHYLAIPPSLFEAVIKGLGTANLANARARDSRKAVWTRLGLREGAQCRCAGGIPGRLDLSHRSLPREGSDHEYPLLPLRQFLPGTDLEPQLRGQRSSHPIRGFRCGGPRRVLRKRRLSARRDREPPFPDSRATGHGAAGRKGLWSCPRRESQGLSSDAPPEARRLGAWPVRWLPQGAGRGQAAPTSRPFARFGFSSTRGAGRECRGTCVPANI